MMTPRSDERRITIWTEYVAAGPDKENRAERLRQVPDVMRDAVRQEVVWLFQRTRRMTLPPTLRLVNVGGLETGEQK